MSGTSWEAALAALEWGKVVSRLCSHAASEPGRDRCAAIVPGRDLDAIRVCLEENRDGRRMLSAEGPLPLEGLKEIAPQMEKAVKGASLSPGELLLVGQTARTGERIRKYFEERRGKYPRLAHHAKEIPALRDLAEEIEQKIDPSGNLTDRASPSLGPLRRQLLEVRGRLQKTAEGILSSAKYARHVQETYATVRSGRVVIPFKTSAKGLFQGIVHDSSQSGQTVFFEPEELVYLNNEVRMAELEVEREIARILAELSAKTAGKAPGLLACRERLSHLDFAQARSLLAEELAASEPTVTASGEMHLIAARHPLLVLGRKEVVPNDLRFGRPRLCLILTGPNAGGKTVALKTLGLLTLMAMAGLSIPAAADSTVSVYSRIFVTLGDEQSVEQDLSTYSAHIRRLNEILAGADRGSLVLLDEVVSGTDPREGAAIARAFLEALADREVRVVATTHFEELKGIAFTDPRFENGSMAFDGEHLRPTYRLSLGVPGRSMGIEIARSLGFPEEVLERAMGYLSGPGQELTEVIDRLERERERVRASAADLSARSREAEARPSSALRSSRAAYSWLCCSAAPICWPRVRWKPWSRAANGSRTRLTMTNEPAGWSPTDTGRTRACGKRRRSSSMEPGSPPAHTPDPPRNAGSPPGVSAWNRAQPMTAGSARGRWSTAPTTSAGRRLFCRSPARAERAARPRSSSSTTSSSTPPATASSNRMSRK
ncbi:MAG: endonuclease MutS2 [Deltaproteobacteria bacterium]|nr:MAG: endonuclease MutS2 [Deltaproteobacteria bacterium]